MDSRSGNINQQLESKSKLANKIAVKVKKQAEKIVLQGHPWVYESSIIKQNKEAQAGDIAVIFDQRNNKLMAIGLFDPESVIRIRVLHVGGPAKIDKDFLANVLQAAYEKRASLLKTETTAYRLCYGENDGLSGLIIDIYNDVAVVKLYSSVWLPYLDWIKEILVGAFNIKSIVLRLNRNLQAHLETFTDGQIIFGTLESEEVVFLEHALKFRANLIKGHKTGYFLDHRNNRLKVRSLAKNKRVLDVFSYAGGFSVNAIAGGAKTVTSLDISAQALEIAKSNVALNFQEAQHFTMAIDAFEGLKELLLLRKEFDLVIVDPPSFAKSEEQVAKAINSYKRLVKAVLPIVAKDGILLMASCSSRVSKSVFFELVTEEIRRLGSKFTILETATHDVDHPEGISELSYLKSIYLQLDT
jgi:23S rRNA (cytosine1962-C5)-methyltransferase